MEFRTVSDAELSATLAAIENIAGTETMQTAIKAEMQFRTDNAAALAAHAELVTLTESASKTLAGVRHSTVKEISDPDGAIVKNARLTLIKLVMATYELSVSKAEKVLLVLADESGQTDSNGSVDYAVDYVNAHPKSTVYRTTESHPADAAQSAPAKADSKPTESK